MNPLTLALEHTNLMLATDKFWRECAKWVGTGLISTSAILVALSTDMSLAPLPFVGFFLGHIIWGLSALAMRENALIALNLGFIPFDTYAIFIRS